MHNTRWSRVPGVLLAIGILAFGAGTSVHARTAAHPQKGLVNITLQLKWENQAQFAGYYVALDKGFYRQQGLNVTIRPGGPDVVPEQVVASNGAQFGIDWLSALLVAREKGVPIQNIAQIYQASGMRLIAFKSTHISSIQGFKGKTVGVWPSGNEYQFYALMFKQHLWPPSHFMTVANQPFEMTPFLNHTLDVAHAMTYNELGVVLETGIKRSQLNIFDYNRLGVSILEDGIFARPDWLHSHRGLAVKFLKASIAGWQWAIQHPDLAGKLSYQRAANSPGGLYHQVFMAREVAKLIHFGPGLTHAIGYMDPTVYKRTWSTLLREHVIAHPPVNGYNQSYWLAATAGH